MGLLDGLEKLINEHGSATILKERVALANDKYAALESKAKALETEKAALARENENLRLDLQKATEKIRDLEAQLIVPPKDRLEQIREELLQFIAAHPDMSADQISRALNKNVEIIKFHLTELKKSHLLNQMLFMGSPAKWSLSHDGRAYLISHGLLS